MTIAIHVGHADSIANVTHRELSDRVGESAVAISMYEIQFAISIEEEGVWNSVTVGIEKRVRGNNVVDRILDDDFSRRKSSVPIIQEHLNRLAIQGGANQEIWEAVAVQVCTRKPEDWCRRGNDGRSELPVSQAGKNSQV